MAELHPENASTAARTALGYAQAFDGKGIDWQSDDPWPHRVELAQALDWTTELSAMVINLADRVLALGLAEEGSKVAFGHVVEQKQAAEAECKRLRRLLDAAYADIRANQRAVKAETEAALLRGAPLDISQLKDAGGRPLDRLVRPAGRRGKR